MKAMLTVLTLFFLLAKVGDGQAVTWRCSTATAPWADKGTLTATAPDAGKAPDITVDGAVASQQIEGWGGCFNELGWDALSALDNSTRQSVLRSLFDTKAGCGFNLCRMPVGSSDFAMGYYSLDDTPGDYAMAHFSDARDREKLVPYVKAAMAYRRDLKVWGSPWSPPAWMTTNGKYTGGDMTQTPQTLAAYALYLEKAVRAYQKAGLRFYALDVQNEPVYNNNVYPQCKWSGAELRDFIKDYLGPQFTRDRVPVQLWAGTFPTGDYDGYPGAILSDPAARAYISGVGFQWGGRNVIARTRDAYPQLDLMETEMECGDGTDTWGYGEYTFDLMRQYLAGGARSFMQWNMVLDQTGKSSWGWAQNAMVTIHKDTKAVTYNPQFYAVKHFSSYVKPGAFLVQTGGPDADAIAFRDPDGSLVLVVKNGGAQDTPLTVTLNDRQIRPTLPAHSISTFVEKGFTMAAR